MATSRSPMWFQRRHGLVVEAVRPLPRTSPADWLIHYVPFEAPPGPNRTVLQAYEGSPSPDRNVTRDWPKNDFPVN